MTRFPILQLKEPRIMIREARIIDNENFKKINIWQQALQQIESITEEAKDISSQASQTATEALNRSAVTQQQLDNIILENGNSDPEVTQARGPFDLLYERFEEIEKVLTRLEGTVLNLDIVIFKRFGGIGDGVSDDSQALQNAIDFATTNNISTVFINFDIAVAQKIELNGKVGLNLRGKTVHLMNDFPIGESLFTVAGNKNRLYNGKIKGYEGNKNTAIKSLDFRDSSLYGLEITDFGYFALELEQGNSSFLNKIIIRNTANNSLDESDPYISGCVRLTNFSKSFFHNFDIKDSFGKGISLAYCVSCEVSADIENMGKSNENANGSGLYITSGCVDIIVTRANLKKMGVAAVKISRGALRTKIYDMHAVVSDNDNTDGGDVYAIILQGGQGTEIINSYVDADCSNTVVTIHNHEETLDDATDNVFKNTKMHNRSTNEASRLIKQTSGKKTKFTDSCELTAEQTVMEMYDDEVCIENGTFIESFNSDALIFPGISRGSSISFSRIVAYKTPIICGKYLKVFSCPLIESKNSHGVIVEDYTTITGNTIKSALRGIYAQNRKGVKLHKNDVESSDYGISLGSRSSEISVKHNIVKSAAAALHGADANNSSVFGNSFESESGNSIDLGSSSSNNRIIGNDIPNGYSLIESENVFQGNYE